MFLPGLTLWSHELDGYQIRRAAAELRNELQQIPDISATQLIGGQRRTMLVEPNRSGWPLSA